MNRHLRSKDQIDQFKERLRKLAGSYRTVFNSHDGKLVLEHLVEIFDHDDLIGQDPYKTAQNIGKRDVVRHIQRMMDYTEQQDG